MASYSRQMSDADATKLLEDQLSNTKVATSHAISNPGVATFNKFENSLGALTVQLRASKCTKQADEVEATKKAFAKTHPEKRLEFVKQVAAKIVKMTAAQLIAGKVFGLAALAVVAGVTFAVGTTHAVTMADGSVRTAFDVNNDGTLDAVANSSGIGLDPEAGSSFFELLGSVAGAMFGF